MKFYSEKLDQLFDTPEALADAEQTKTKKAKKTIKEVVEPVVEKKEEIPTKKQLATEVELAEEAVKEAYSNYESAKSKVEELSKKYLTEVNDILEPARRAVKEAETKRYEAIRRFNDSYGVYQVTYTGARAADEMVKAINSINAQANKLFRDMFWI